MEEVGILSEYQKLQPEAAYVLAYEVLIGQVKMNPCPLRS